MLQYFRYFTMIWIVTVCVYTVCMCNVSVTVTMCAKRGEFTIEISYIGALMSPKDTSWRTEMPQLSYSAGRVHSLPCLCTPRGRNATVVRQNRVPMLNVDCKLSRIEAMLNVVHARLKRFAVLQSTYPLRPRICVTYLRIVWHISL